MLTTKKGFTAVELVIALAFVSISLVSIYSLYMSFIRMHTKEGVKVKLQQNLRFGLDMMVRDIRMAGLDPAITHDFGIIGPLNPWQIRFSADRDMDGYLDEPNVADGINESDLERMAYVYNGADTIDLILYNSDGTEEMRAMLLDNVSDITFTYLDWQDAPTAVAEDVRSIEIDMTVQKPAGRHGMVSRNLIKRLKCRNLDFH